jgi:hypothetical protein
MADVAPSLQKLVALSALFLAVGCAKPAKPVAAPEADYDWSKYNGGNEAPSAADKATADKPVTDGASATAAKAPASEDDTPRPGKVDLSPKKPSKAKIRGQSVSSVSAESVAGASKAALKSKVLSSDVIAGPEYELVRVVLKDASVQIIRPAASPDSGGPKLRSPKLRNDSLTTNESAWYDADADVLVLVQAKSGASKKALGALLKK